jgi:hypothetical protein
VAGRIDLNALGQAIDTTWGRSSTPHGASQSVKFKLEGSSLVATYSAVVNMGTEHERVMMRRRYSEESVSVIAAAIVRLKKDYNGIVETALVLRETSSRDSLEIVGASPHNPRRTALYRRQTLFALS